MCCCFFRGIRSRMLRRGKYARWFGSIGLRRQRKSERTVRGGEGSSLGYTPRHWNANLMEELPSRSGPLPWNRGNESLLLCLTAGIV